MSEQTEKGVTGQAVLDPQLSTDEVVAVDKDWNLIRCEAGQRRATSRRPHTADGRGTA
jgi:hypothetical protein